jgi:hypothetical protein
MEKVQKLELIKGNFSPSEAKEILMNVFLSKIQFHQSKNFSSKERLGKEEINAVTRIEELKKSLEMINKIISDAELKNETLFISSEIKIESPSSQP